MIEEKSIKDVSSDKLLSFDCGEEKLNVYLISYAKQNDKKA